TGVRFTQFSAGSGYSLALGSDGNLYSWGDNSSGQLGTGSTDYSPHSTPSKGSMPTDGTKFTQISAGNYHSLAMGTDGNLYSWGSNGTGALGRETNQTPENLPGVVTPPTGVRFTQ
ncbi:MULTISPECIES: hypothetical protein, partial [Bifidobacterium]|uniref:hypothetical protein n=1 Tax=Bifidobacterium TaxID=1678 RepID=UPI0018DBC74F